MQTNEIPKDAWPGRSTQRARTQIMNSYFGIPQTSVSKEEKISEQILKAVVVSMYVYCDSTSLEHYRPISLLTSWYKVIAALV